MVYFSYSCSSSSSRTTKYCAV